MATAEPARAGDEMRQRYPAIFAAVRRVDDVQISLDFTRVLVHYLGELSKKCVQENGCAPEDLIASQHVLVEAVVADGSRRREAEWVCAPSGLLSGYDLVGTEAAAKMLGLKADTVRWHCRKGNLEYCTVGGRIMVSVASIESLKARLDLRKGA
jgi:hypothetical protein